MPLAGRRLAQVTATRHGAHEASVAQYGYETEYTGIGGLESAMKGIAKQRKEGSFRERKIFVRKEHFIIIAIDI